jgi:hypothetical protein
MGEAGVLLLPVFLPAEALAAPMQQAANCSRESPPTLFTLMDGVGGGSNGAIPLRFNDTETTHRIYDSDMMAGAFIPSLCGSYSTKIHLKLASFQQTGKKGNPDAIRHSRTVLSST